MDLDWTATSARARARAKARAQPGNCLVAQYVSRVIASHRKSLRAGSVHSTTPVDPHGVCTCGYM